MFFNSILVQLEGSHIYIYSFTWIMFFFLNHHEMKNDININIYHQYVVRITGWWLKKINWDDDMSMLDDDFISPLKIRIYI